jgi:hypothetical protein
MADDGGGFGHGKVSAVFWYWFLYNILILSGYPLANVTLFIMALLLRVMS